jgi:septal ring factor EnvC (AmiA/AmiB activator)
MEIGTILTIGSFLLTIIGVAVAYGMQKQKIAQLMKAMDEDKQTHNKIMDELKEVQQKIPVIELKSDSNKKNITELMEHKSSTDITIANVQSTLNQLNHTMDRIEKHLDKLEEKWKNS